MRDVIDGKVLHRLQVLDKAISIIKDEGDAVPAVAGRGNDFPGYPGARQESPAFMVTDGLGI